jgi:hypothetical protein
MEGEDHQLHSRELMHFDHFGSWLPRSQVQQAGGRDQAQGQPNDSG